ncbi:hypothetical protein C1646_665474 [Rhizophagus diaphanus]|nr:hypothetical protein C1646_665474 [Rhizophagus diaphanus] [Rhizophagus sp. MUCL 43196]
MSQPNISTWLQKEHQSLGTELFISAQEFKESLLNDLEEISWNEEAQLYALSAIQLQNNNSQRVTQDFIKTKKIFDKVRENFHFDRKTIQESVNNDMNKIFISLMLKADRSLVRYQAFKELILHAKKHALKHQKEGTLLFEELKIREKLNNIMSEILKAYDEGKYQKSLEELSVEFKPGASLLKLKKRGDIINIDYIINTLLKYGFRSDSIAYLLNSLSEILSSEKIKIEGKITKELKSLAMNAFDGVLSEELETRTKILDSHIFELREKYIIRSTFKKFKDYVSLEEYSDIAQEHKNDSQDMPFQLRLEEIRIITKINQAIFDISGGSKEEIKRAIETIKEVQISINNNYQFVDAAKLHYEVLKNLLWVICNEEIKLLTYDSHVTT